MKAFFALLGTTVVALPTENVGGFDLGTFENPSASARPRFRYWIPDASVNLSTVRDDIADAGSIGAGQLK